MRLSIYIDTWFILCNFSLSKAGKYNADCCDIFLCMFLHSDEKSKIY